MPARSILLIASTFDRRWDLCNSPSGSTTGVWEVLGNGNEFASGYDRADVKVVLIFLLSEVGGLVRLGPACADEEDILGVTGLGVRLGLETEGVAFVVAVDGPAADEAAPTETEGVEAA